MKEADKQLADVLILDTAGRLAVDAEMMAEIQTLHQTVEPVETLFVVDAMTGQDAANTAKAFNEALPLTGIVLAKTDGDARGGAALSVRAITGKPIKFMGIGERTEGLSRFIQTVSPLAFWVWVSRSSKKQSARSIKTKPIDSRKKCRAGASLI